MLGGDYPDPNDDIKVFYSMTELNGGDQFFNSKQEAPVRLPP